MTVMGYTSDRPLYINVPADASAKASTYQRERGSSQYDAIIIATTIEPKIVSIQPSSAE
jgi:hypothetical protein